MKAHLLLLACLASGCSQVPLAEVPEAERRYFSDFGVEKMPPMKAGDWLSEHSESGQTYGQFIRFRQARPRGSILYLRPVGEMEGQFELARAYCEVFFQRPVRALPELRAGKSRINASTQKRQLLVSDLVSRMRPDFPADGLCQVAITNDDLYPQESWNYVFGQAWITLGIGVFSFARYDPAFFGEERPADWETLRLRRCCKVVAHETSHLLGLAHCIDYNCLMNGSNHLNELDSHSFFLCPVCLRKLRHRLQFDVAKRYRELRVYCQQQKLTEEAAWVERRLAQP